MKYGGPKEIPPAKALCPMDRFENIIREMGVECCCEWFGHQKDSDFTKSTIEILLERSRNDNE